MNLVADEGVDKAIVDALRAGGFSPKYFAEAGAGAADKEVLATANDAQPSTHVRQGLRRACVPAAAGTCGRRSDPTHWHSRGLKG